ncbi:hypothetical protein CDAR_164861 [Caerostris darwini]|uniref:Uncharacterized protein n=1 Tax=Caerostris darwini TaxID=1538125 RepID=A0AAV4T3E0_9ARAC|nr:hypothetical protein CDAR_164861 [Caerostris darwini]
MNPQIHALSRRQLMPVANPARYATRACTDPQINHGNLSSRQSTQRCKVRGIKPVRTQTRSNLGRIRQKFVLSNPQHTLRASSANQNAEFRNNGFLMDGSAVISLIGRAGIGGLSASLTGFL